MNNPRTVRWLPGSGVAGNGDGRTGSGVAGNGDGVDVSGDHPTPVTTVRVRVG